MKYDPEPNAPDITASQPAASVSRQGRPPEGRDLVLECFVLEAFERLRISGGLVLNAAIAQTVKEVKSRFPGKLCKSTKVKKIVAKMHPEGIPKAFRVGQFAPDEAFFNEWRAIYAATGDQYIVEMLQAIQENRCANLNFGIGERPDYPKRGRQQRRRTIRFGK